MSTQVNQAQVFEAPLPVFDTTPEIAIVVARWNGHITEALLDGALKVLDENGCNTEVVRVPGTIELTYAASLLMQSEKYDAIIVLGCVIKGDTPHFDYVCQSVTLGITQLNLEGDAPVIFGVLTTLDEQQALDRAGGRLGNKGAEAAITALHMVEVNWTYNE